MKTILILAATIAFLSALNLTLSYSRVLPYPNWQPRDNEDSLSQDITPYVLSIGPLIVYRTIPAMNEPCSYRATTRGSK